MFKPDPRWLQPQVLERASALPAPFYTDPAAFEAERQVVFSHGWQLVAHAGQLQQAGDHVVA
ncbi:MAG: hypothetical protein RQ847_04305 [Wenzhouxiangellaceae bacterium]|nr:hypothetical protein [Wenzhouxiangellaceae bacterium]